MTRAELEAEIAEQDVVIAYYDRLAVEISNKAWSHKGLADTARAQLRALPPEPPSEREALIALPPEPPSEREALIAALTVAWVGSPASVADALLAAGYAKRPTLTAEERATVEWSRRMVDSGVAPLNSNRELLALLDRLLWGGA